MIELITGIATSFIIIVISSLLSKHVSVKLVAATILCSIAFIYVGFALTENVTIHIIFEASVALLFYFIAIIGYSQNSYWIAYGIILHGFWDFFHNYVLEVKTIVPEYWALYCFVVDMLLGIYFFLQFKIKEVEIKKNAFK